MRTRKSEVLGFVSFVLLLGATACGGSVSDDGLTGSGGASGGSAGSGNGPGAGGTGNTGNTGGGCGPDAKCAQGCMYEGQFYAIGESFKAIDGCNTCTCESPTAISCTKMACPEGCFYNGQQYSPGQSFPAGDGCNTCTCGPDGQVGCTLMACVEPCTYNGKQYPIGAQFPSIDGCNTCSCTATGVSCTEKACPCDPAKEWWRNYIATDPNKCALIDFMCPANTKHFSNQCGCGCEQDPSCPQWFDCMPPAPCNVPEIKAKCPYSGIAY